jgi:hypothetical protein
VCQNMNIIPFKEELSMEKKVVLALAAAMAVTATSFASPLTNYEKGNLAVDINTSLSPKVEMNTTDLRDSDDAKSRLGAGFTYGLGDKLAVQYKYADNKTKTYSYEVATGFSYQNGTTTGQLIANELNVLYKVNPNVSAFAGWTNATAKIKWSYNYGPDASNITDSGSGTEKGTKDGFQVGLIGQTKFAKNLTGWGSIAAGNNLTGYELGLGYDLDKDTELNVFYRHAKYKDFNVDGENFDVKIKGVGAGLTFKFN